MPAFLARLGLDPRDKDPSTVAGALLGGAMFAVALTVSVQWAKTAA
jgi:hypothetical protein